MSEVKQSDGFLKGPSNPCGCHQCLEDRDEMRFHMVLCSICGNKRCPHATDHRHPCTHSNDDNQPGSIYGGHELIKRKTKGEESQHKDELARAIERIEHSINVLIQKLDQDKRVYNTPPMTVLRGCVCPPGSEIGCNRYDCGRRAPTIGFATSTSIGSGKGK